MAGRGVGKAQTLCGEGYNMRAGESRQPGIGLSISYDIASSSPQALRLILSEGQNNIRQDQLSRTTGLDLGLGLLS